MSDDMLYEAACIAQGEVYEVLEMLSKLEAEHEALKVKCANQEKGIEVLLKNLVNLMADNKRLRFGDRNVGLLNESLEIIDMSESLKPYKGNNPDGDINNPACFNCTLIEPLTRIIKELQMKNYEHA